MPEAPFLIVGTKQDLRNDANFASSNQVSTQDGETLAKETGAKTYVECSALTQDGLKNVFDGAIRWALDSSKKSGGKQGCSCILL